MLVWIDILISRHAWGFRRYFATQPVLVLWGTNGSLRWPRMVVIKMRRDLAFLVTLHEYWDVARSFS